MNETNCIFCKITSGEIPCDKVYEDEQTFAFLDIKPTNPGHTLVIPKNHHTSVSETPNETLGAMMSTVKKVANTFPSAVETSDYNIWVNTGPVAGQVVFHAHIHVIPRHPGDGYELWHGNPYNEGQAQPIVEKMKNALH